MVSKCEACGARAPTSTEIASALRNAFVVCRCPNDGTVQEVVACFTDPDAAVVFADYERAAMNGTPYVLAWMRDTLMGQIDAELQMGLLDAEQAKRCLRAVTDGFDAVDRVLVDVSREHAQKKVH